MTLKEAIKRLLGRHQVKLLNAHRYNSKVKIMFREMQRLPTRELEKMGHAISITKQGKRWGKLLIY